MNEGHEVIPELKPSDVQEFCFLFFTTELITMLTSLIGTCSYLIISELYTISEEADVPIIHSDGCAMFLTAWPMAITSYQEWKFTLLLRFSSDIKNHHHTK